ncbi:phosphodiester glycosidase family protein [Kitasatospora sp. NPDC048540]|uniref:phosphodiester glycosidase family protein n=1 Tax=Kitasatospora sp. NPDC048540 TaxID=3155634 RepID=UPI0033D572BE
MRQPAGRAAATGTAIVRARIATALAVCALVAGPGLPAGPAAAADGAVERLAPGVEYRAFTVPTAHGGARVHLVTADLRRTGVRAGLLYQGVVAARERVSRMAEAQGALAAVNGDFFDISEAEHPGIPATGAPSGPVVADGRALKAAVPPGQRFGVPSLPGDSEREVVGVGVDGVARTARLVLRGQVRTPAGSSPLRGLNQYALAAGSIGAFTADWGGASRARAACGTDTDRGGPCTGDTWELTVRHGRVAAASATAGSGPVPPGDLVLFGREEGAQALRGAAVGTPVGVDYRLVADSGRPFSSALGAHRLLAGGRPLPGLDREVAEPRTAVGLARGGRVLRLLATDGREHASSGLTLGELADLLASSGCEEGVYLDGGGSSTLVTRDPGSGRVAVRNRLDQGFERAVANGLAIFPGRPGAPAVTGP